MTDNQMVTTPGAVEMATPNSERLDETIARLSDGRVTFDPRRRRLTRSDEGGAQATIEISEVDLRNWLQRLLLARPRPVGMEPHESAILLMIDRLDDAESGPEGVPLVS